MAINTFPLKILHFKDFIYLFILAFFPLPMLMSHYSCNKIFIKSWVYSTFTLWQCVLGIAHMNFLAGPLKLPPNLYLLCAFAHVICLSGENPLPTANLSHLLTHIHASAYASFSCEKRFLSPRPS